MNSAIFRSISRLPTSSIRSSRRAIAISAARSLRPTLPSPTGATSSTTPPSPPPSPIAWWKTPRSSSWEVKAFAKVIRASLQLNNRFGWLRSGAALWRYPARRSPSGNPSTALSAGAGASLPLSAFHPHSYVQLQRQSSALAFAYGIPQLCRVPHAGRLHPPGLPPLRLHQIPNHHVRPLLLRVGKGQQRGQTLPGHRVGQEGHPTQPGSAVTPGVDGAGEAPMN